MAEIKKGTKIEDRSKFNKAEMAVLVSQPREQEVQGQAIYQDLFMCPWCGNLGWAYADTNYYVWVTCGTCWGAFQV